LTHFKEFQPLSADNSVIFHTLWLLKFTRFGLYGEGLKESTGGTQLTLNRALEKPIEVKTCMCDEVTHAVAQFIVCNDQVCMMVVQRVDVDIV
jgi:hypothetical protein